MLPLALLPLLLPAPASASNLLGLSTPPLHLTVAVDMTGSSKNPAYKYADQARLLSQSVLLNQLRSGDTLTLLRICDGVQTVADFQFNSRNGARMARADILRYTGALTKPCTGKGSAITAGLAQAAKRGSQTAGVGDVVVLFTDGALLDDPKRAALGSTVSGLLKRTETRALFVAGLSPEPGAGGASIRDAFVKALGNAARDKRLLLAGAYDLSNVYPTFANVVKGARR
ncbi:VWA domain-containing protein [Deinococcus multiflagellatus]|uniref:VWA domain-containing protein n=1 Tax=Deinococcus multiflagellatus TaxID=1656887 RepID=A0ABW1ZFA9_9DEIO|nr:VWA domain-containing protein [Deinococcus multiflagellatus]MBZ9712881.1 VWA domain-containing protein [Deinococcus multiflagellatus]